MPVLAATAAAPAFAASNCVPLTCAALNTALGFGAGINANNWSGSITGTFRGDQAPVYSTTFNPGPSAGCGGNCTDSATGYSPTPVVLFGGDPQTATSTATYAKTAVACLNIGTYSFSWRWVYYGCLPKSATVTLYAIRTKDNATFTLGSVTAPGANPDGSNLQGTATGSLTVTNSTDQFTFRFVWTFGSENGYGTACNQQGNDIGVTAPTVTCA